MKQGENKPVNTLSKEQAMFFIAYAATIHDVPPEWIIGQSRISHICKARDEAVALMSAAGGTLSVIGRYLDNRDHTTILTAKRRFEARNKRLPHPNVMKAMLSGIGYSPTNLAAENQKLHAEVLKLKADLKVYDKNIGRAYGIIALRNELDELRSENEYLRDEVNNYRSRLNKVAPYSELARSGVAA